MSVQIFIYLSDVMSVDSLKQLEFCFVAVAVFVVADTTQTLLCFVYLLWGGGACLVCGRDTFG